MTLVRCGTATSTGLVRDTNEDNMFAGERIFVVADGMGGHAAGEVASALVVDRLRALDERGELGLDDIRTELAAANQEMLADVSPEHGGMGTTVSGIALLEVDGTPHWIVFNIGDSRVYRFADDELARLTVDHSEVEELVAQGLLTPEQALLYPRRNIVTRALGTSMSPEPDQWVFPARPGERFVVCTDGLTNEISDGVIAEVMRGEEDAVDAADVLVRLAVAAGGRDNVTTVVVDLVDVEVSAEVDVDVDAEVLVEDNAAGNT
ncbi:serine/threonine-protein phosphatase [Lentzea tibetensis]|uniref:Serine/threonine-protein phosphatase n=1 Tax=Lentzea tibetensis TaxID=2591470 RepID=A0A563ET73_9PSEU|nr:protein phosphatase 2C domain-containing protein [Lentzea tibetensis]TWP50691.1 serine/threonine-protein phosphatase [Lentzea tibetensis]